MPPLGEDKSGQYWAEQRQWAAYFTQQAREHRAFLDQAKQERQAAAQRLQDSRKRLHDLDKKLQDLDKNWQGSTAPPKDKDKISVAGSAKWQ